MTATTEKAGSPAGVKLPPEPKFWKHYSPHHEAPLSLAGSIAIHALFFVGGLLGAAYLAQLFYKPTTSLPVEPVRLVERAGGGGDPKGTKGGVAGGGNPKENLGGDDTKDPTIPELKEEPPLAPLNKIEAKQVEEKFSNDDARWISESKSNTAKAFARMDQTLSKMLANSVPAAQGKRGSGSGGGSGSGTGTGTGSGTGDGKITLNQREKRMLRWQMTFTANNGSEYLAQLRDLGAILAIPVSETKGFDYRIVRDLKFGGNLLKEDLSKIQRIYWIDDRPHSVRDIVMALGLKLPRIPSRFVAFMPEALEQQLYDMERSYAENVLGMKPFNEDRIDETTFRVVRTPKGHKPELIRVTVK